MVLNQVQKPKNRGSQHPNRDQKGTRRSFSTGSSPLGSSVNRGNGNLRAFTMCNVHLARKDHKKYATWPIYSLLLSSTLAIWLCNTPHRLGVLRRPLDFLRVVAGDRHAKSRPAKNLYSCWKARSAIVGRWGQKPYSSWSVGGRHLDQRFWGVVMSSISIPFARKWLKSS